MAKKPTVDSNSSIDNDQKYQTQNDVRTLVDAHAIHSDKARHGRAKAHAKEQLAALKGVTSSPIMTGMATPDA